MMEQHYIATETICFHYEIEIEFINELEKMELIPIEIIEQKRFIHLDHIGELEKIIRLHHELNVNLEGIDVVLNLLEKEKALRNELNILKNRLKRYENE